MNRIDGAKPFLKIVSQSVQQKQRRAGFGKPYDQIHITGRCSAALRTTRKAGLARHAPSPFVDGPPDISGVGVAIPFSLALCYHDTGRLSSGISGSFNLGLRDICLTDIAGYL